MTRDEWLAHQLRLVEAHVLEERRRLHEETKRRQAVLASMVLSLPEMMLSDEQNEQEADEPRRRH